MNRKPLVYIALGGAIVVPAALVRWVSRLDPPITNGVLHETARLDVSDYASIVVPETATVERAKQTSYVEILLEKELAFRGHPPYPVHIERARDYFGAAYKREGDALVLATYGEWFSVVDGGAAIRMRVVVPERISVTTQPRLCGDDSRAHGDIARWAELLDGPELQKCYWYSPISPATGWTRISGETVLRSKSKLIR